MTFYFSIIFLLTSCLFLSLVLFFSIKFIPKFEYIKSRILSFFNSETGTHNFQSEKAIESITSGGFFGKGIGEGVLKNRVPEAHTDYIISVISEEFGVVAIILILLLFLIFIYMVFKKINFEKDDKVKLLNLKSESYNGQECVVRHYDCETNRYNVFVNSMEKIISVKEENLENLSNYDLVIIHTPHTSFNKIDFENIKSLIFEE